MLTNPVYDRFRLRFSSTFLIPEVEESFKWWFDRQDEPFIDMVSYLNNKVINVDLPGIKTDVQQQSNQNGTKRSYSGALSSESSIQKKLSIQFKVQNNFFGYFLMRKQIKAFIDRYKDNKDYFLPPIYFEVIDDYGSILFTQVYHDIVFSSISGISMKKSDIGISYKEFTCDFMYNKFEENCMLEEENYIDRKQEYIY